MRFRGTPGWIRRGRVLAGLVGLVGALGLVRAGQPIQFSNPKQEVDAPPKKEIIVEPKRTLKWSFSRPEDDIPPPPVIIDPALEKKLRQRLEERKNWLFNEPELFRDKFPDPFKLREDPTEMKTALDETVERILGKPDDQARKRPESEAPARTGPLFSETPLFDRDKPAKTDWLDPRERDKKKDDRDWRTATERSIRSLFDPAAETALPVQPGMSLYEMLGAVKDKTQRLEDERRRSEFTRIINPHAAPPPPRNSVFDPINLQEDQTRQPVNPITPVIVPRVPEPKSSPSPLLLPNPVETASRPPPLAQPATPFQTPPVPTSQDKARQIESLKLINRPSTFDFPTRRF